MSLFDLDKFAKKMKESADGIAKSVSDAVGKMPEIKQEDIAAAAKKATQAGQKVAQAGQTAFNAAVAKSQEAKEKKEQVAAQTNNQKGGMADHTLSDGELSLTVQGTLKIIYYLMMVDGDLVSEEKEKFDLIGQELDPGFAEYKDSLIESCSGVVKGAVDKDEYYDIIHDQISEVIRVDSSVSGVGIRGKLILWDLYAVAYSDASYSDEEKRFIRYICRALHIDSVIAQEMEQTLRTMRAIENEESWLRTTNRQYKVVEDRINELADRKQTIMQGIQALIAD